MLAPEALSTLREGILWNCFDAYEGTHANGDTANNKIDLELLEGCHGLAALAVSGLAQILRPLPGLLIPVPNGGNWLGEQLHLALGRDVMFLRKDPETGEISTDPAAEEMYEDVEELEVIEDVPNSFTNTRKVLSLPWIAKRKVVKVVAVWDRGDSKTRAPLPVPYEAIIAEPIPRMLPKNSPYWRYILPGTEFVR